MKPRIKQIEEDVILPRVLFYRGRRPRWITPSEICLILHILRKPLVQLYGRRCEDCVRRPLNVLPTTRHGSHVLLVTGSDAYCNGEKGNKAPVRDLNSRSLRSRRLEAPATQATTPGTSLACTASVSVVEKVQTSAKKRNEVFSLQLLRNNSIGNACYAG